MTFGELLGAMINSDRIEVKKNDDRIYKGFVYLLKLHREEMQRIGLTGDEEVKLIQSGEEVKPRAAGQKERDWCEADHRFKDMDVRHYFIIKI